MRLYFILAFICKTVMVWPGANNQLDYNTVPDIQKYYLDGSNIHIVLMDMNTTLGRRRLHIPNLFVHSAIYLTGQLYIPFMS